MVTNTWEFQVKKGYVDGFLNINQEDWPDFFKKSPGYKGTIVRQWGDDPLCYRTIDEWESESHFDDLIGEYSDEFKELDVRHKKHYHTEKHLGWST